MSVPRSHSTPSLRTDAACPPCGLCSSSQCEFQTPQPRSSPAQLSLSCSASGELQSTSQTLFLHVHESTLDLRAHSKTSRTRAPFRAYSLVRLATVELVREHRVCVHS